jgi:hypothetical protein
MSACAFSPEDLDSVQIWMLPDLGEAPRSFFAIDTITSVRMTYGIKFGSYIGQRN